MDCALIQAGLDSDPGPDTFSIPALAWGLGLCAVGVVLAWLAQGVLKGGWPRYYPSRPVHLGYLLGAVVFYISGIAKGQTWWLGSEVSPQESGLGPWSLPAMLAVQSLGCLASAGVAWVWVARGSGDLGLRRRGAGRALSAASATWLLCLPLFYGLGLIWQWTLFHWHGSVQTQDWIERFGEAGGTPLALAALLAILVLPFLEEVVFRGLLQSALVSRLGSRPGVILTALLFALLHGQPSFLPVFALALLLGAIKQRTGSLWASTTAHVFHNGLQIALLASALGAI